MAQTPEAAKELGRARLLVLDALRGQPVRVYLFGSWATGRAGRASDIDVAVWPTAPLPVGLLGTVRKALEESTLVLDVDLIDLGESDPAFRRRVLTEGVLWSEPENA